MVETTRLVCIARKAGMEALKNYQAYKNGGGPELLDEAQYGSFNIITEKLDHFYRDIPVFSRLRPDNGKADACCYFLVDPLADTESFINKQETFTVNITYVLSGRPVCGVVHAPALNDSLFADERGGFFYNRYTQTGRLAGFSMENISSPASLAETLRKFLNAEDGNSADGSAEESVKVICD